MAVSYIKGDVIEGPGMEMYEIKIYDESVDQNGDPVTYLKSTIQVNKQDLERQEEILQTQLAEVQAQLAALDV